MSRAIQALWRQEWAAPAIRISLPLALPLGLPLLLPLAVRNQTGAKRRNCRPQRGLRACGLADISMSRSFLCGPVMAFSLAPLTLGAIAIASALATQRFSSKPLAGNGQRRRPSRTALPPRPGKPKGH